MVEQSTLFPKTICKIINTKNREVLDHSLLKGHIICNISKGEDIRNFQYRFYLIKHYFFNLISAMNEKLMHIYY